MAPDPSAGQGGPLRWLRRRCAWRIRIRATSRRVPRNPLVWADIVALHPVKGPTAVLAAPLIASQAPLLAPALEALARIWSVLFALGFLRMLRLLRLRSAPCTWSDFSQPCSWRRRWR